MTALLLAMIGAAVATVSNVLAARRAYPPYRRLYWVTAGFSLFYVGAWAWLILFPDTDRGAWSKAVTPVSTATFFIVWSANPLVSYFQNHPPEE